MTASSSVHMRGNARAKLLPFVRLAELDDPSALAGSTPRMRVCIEAGELKFSADVFANEAGKVRFSAWSAERLDDELGAESLQLSKKELPDPVQEILQREKDEIENSARHGWIDARLAVIDETHFWHKSIVEKAGKMYCTYLYDAQRVTYCGELSPSYELNKLYDTPLNCLEDEAAREELDGMICDGAAGSDDIVYMHCRSVDRMPDANLESYHCFALDPDEDYRKQFESIREHLLGNCRLQLPEDAPVHQDPAIALPGQRMSLEEFAREVIVLDIHQDEISGDVVWGPYVSDASRQAAHHSAMAEFDENTRSMIKQNRLLGFHSEDEAVLAYRENFLKSLAGKMPDVLFLNSAESGRRPLILCGLLVRPDDLISECYKTYCQVVPREAALEVDSYPEP